jgi:hypothetical protein
MSKYMTIRLLQKMESIQVLGEEKKEAQEEGGGEHMSVGDSAIGSKASVDYHDEDEYVDDESEELEDLPPEIAKQLGSSSFKSEEELELALVKAGVGDLPVILLDGKPRLVMPSSQHNAFTADSIHDFIRCWSKDRWGNASSTHKVRLPNGRSRDPDLSYWGYPRCDRDGRRTLRPVDREFDCVPDVVIQFSWKNKAQYEENAINDIMNNSLEKRNGAVSTSRPNLGYFVKIRFSKKRTLQMASTGTTSKTQDVEGLDIYRLSHGTTLADARNGNNPKASYWRYEPGGPEHFITIAPGDLGITGFWAFFCGGYSLKASEIFKEMQRMQTSLQRHGLP